jgi:hypothetical protein
MTKISEEGYKHLVAALKSVDKANKELVKFSLVEKLVDEKQIMKQKEVKKPVTPKKPKLPKVDEAKPPKPAKAPRKSKPKQLPVQLSYPLEEPDVVN